MSKQLILFLLFAMMHYMTVAQNYRVAGTVSDKTNRERLEGVNVLLYVGKEKKLLKFTTTTTEGSFRMMIPDSLTGKGYLQFSFMGYETLRKNIDHEKRWDIYLSQKEMTIKEIIVKAPKVRVQGDTITYDVRLFSKEGDRSIGDVLRRMPGIKTNENGQVSYNGTPINRFYIENSDMLEGQYGLATNNISNKEVGSVEILQNHQPVKALEGIAFSEQAAINLKLKEGAKHRWVGTLKSYAGCSPDEGLWDVQGVFMRFNKKRQSMNTFKTNNIGQDISKELNSFNLNALKNQGRLLADYIETEPPFSMGLSRNRELLNRTYQVTTHHLFKLNNGQDIKVNLVCQRHKEESAKEVESIYYEGQNEEWSLDEQEKSDYTKKSFSGTVTTEMNKPTYNLTERFQVSLDWKDRSISMGGNQINQQDMYTGSKKVMNELFLLKRSGNNFVTFSSYAVFQANPQNLHIQGDNKEVAQTVNPKQLFTENNLGWGIVVGKVIIDFTGNFTGMYKDMSCRLTGLENSNISDRADMSLGYMKLALTPKLTYMTGPFKSVLAFPTNYYLYHYKNFSERALNHDCFSISPSLYSEWHFSSRWNLYVRGNINKQAVNTQLFYLSDILTTYRTLQRGLTTFCHAKTAVITGGIEYKIPLKEFYSRLEFSRSWSIIPYVLFQNVEKGYIFSKFLLDSRQIKRTVISGNLSKGTDWASTTFSLQVGWSKNISHLFRNEKTIQNCLTQLYLKPEIDINPAKWINIQYGLNFSGESLVINDNESKESTYTLNQSLLIRFIPSDKLYFSIKSEYYSNQIKDGNIRNFFLTDISLTYKFSDRFSMDFQLVNLFNEREYSYTSFSNEAMRINKRYMIRPGNLLIGAYVTF